MKKIVKTMMKGESETLSEDILKEGSVTTNG